VSPSKKICAIVGARPQFIKHAAVELSIKQSFLLSTIHTGQHYDKNMSDIFFDELNIAKPTHLLQIGSADHGEQTARMMIEIEKIFKQDRPDMLLVYGDTNSTLAGALVASKMHIPIAHVEAGLRSFNKAMPEEINRVLTDYVSAQLFCPTDGAILNLKAENIVQNVYMVGDVMCDMIHIAIQKGILMPNSDKDQYYFSTIHRPYNTDDIQRLAHILTTLNDLEWPVKFAIHPRTLHKLKENNLDTAQFKRLQFLPPVSYFESLQLQFNAKAVITDSGGIQKEAYILKKPCITIRSETEWIETLQGGWNHLVFNDLTQIKSLLASPPGAYTEGVYGTGDTAQKITNHIEEYLGSQ
jgi:UDP-GlcNAc3NAcA epimerase